MYTFKFADIGEGIHEGRILQWMTKVGETIKEGETLCVIETDKVNAEIPSPVTGVIKELGGKIGDIIHVGDMLANIDEGGSKSKAKEEPKTKEEPKKEAVEEGGAGVVGELEISSDVIASSSEQSTQKDSKSSKVLASPLARKMASDMNIDLRTIQGTGEMGRVMKEDLLRFAEQQKTKQTTTTSSTPQVATPQTPTNISYGSMDDVEKVPISTTRKAIVKAMTLSKQIIPHTTVMDEFDVSNLVAFRTEQKPLAEAENIKLTYLAFIVKAVAKVIKEYPIFNASFDHVNELILYKKRQNIGIAVDTPDGLIVPNIKQTEQLSIFDLAKAIQSLASAATRKELKLDQIQNGTFTITNYGAMDALLGTPIIKHPEVAILGIGKITKRPIVRNNEIVIADILPISLSVDHRIIDGADAARFLQKLRLYLSNPMLLLLS